MGIVLVVDDHEESRRLLTMMLERAGHTVIGAATAFEALDAVKTSKPGLILLDLLISPMDGLTFLNQLREDAINHNLPVITVSGLSDPQTISNAKVMGVKEHLVKTQFTPEQLLAAVNRYIQPG